MDCPSDRYVNDSAICAEVVAMLAKVGVKVRLNARRLAASYFAKIVPPERKAAILSAGLVVRDLRRPDALVNLVATRDPSAHAATANIAGYSNPALDALLARIRLEMRSAAGGVAPAAPSPGAGEGRYRLHPAAPAGSGLGGTRQRRTGAARRRQFSPCGTCGSVP